jgi:hypothetical protein
VVVADAGGDAEMVDGSGLSDSQVSLCTALGQVAIEGSGCWQGDSCASGLMGRGVWCSVPETPQSCCMGVLHFEPAWANI